MTRLAILLLTFAACTPASAHRACMRVGPDGKATGSVPDVNSDLSEFRVVEEATFLPSEQRQRYVVGDGAPGFPICSMEVCQRFMDAMGLNLKETPTMKLRAFCEEH